MEMEAYKSLIKKIDRVYDEIKILQNPADQIQREWCSTSEAAKVLGVTVRTVYRYRDQGLLIPNKIGKKYFYCLKEVKTLIGLNRDLSNYNPINKLS